ncbi:hypothetical protein [Neorhizobium sp. NCHU2750]|uniref:hypothetical protein n=1 Tax=Neorhizobium sp. NCHU2750 TaxID=1825976 RepID=UPI000E72A476|nr:hypothetical protein NCHU2750_05970 [Neorhizobium sp. NCHU2750]
MAERPKIADFGVDMRDLERVQRRVRKSLTASHYVASARDVPVILHALAQALSPPPSPQTTKATPAAYLIEMMRERFGSSFDNEATFDGDELEEIIAALECRQPPLPQTTGPQDVFSVNYQGNSITLHFAEIKSAKAFRDTFPAEIINSAPNFPFNTEGQRIADAVLSWLVKYDLADGGEEYRAADVISILDDLAPAPPAHLRVPDGWALVPFKPSPEMVEAGKRWSPLPEQVWTDMIDAAPISDAEQESLAE